MKILILVLAFLSLTNSFNLTILHTNDVHARYEQTNKYSSACSETDEKEEKCYGGYPRLINKVKSIKEQYTNTIVLDGGDQFQGTSWFFHFGGSVTSYFMNLLQYDAMALGNHEFDNKIGGLVPFLDNVTFPVLSSNIDARLEPSMQGKFTKSTILTVGSEQIAVIGYTTTDTPSISSTGKLEFKDEVISVREEVASIKTAYPNINKFIALGHAGFAKDKKIAREVDEIDIVVGGHTNTFLYTGDAPSNEDPIGEYPHVITKSNGEKALVVQDYAYGKYLGFLDVLFTDDGKVDQWRGNPILLDKTVAQDPEVLELMKPWKAEVEVFKKTVLGETQVFLQGDASVCRRQECNLGNVITDGMLRFNLQQVGKGNWNSVSIVIMNSGGIRSPLDQGNITADNVLTVLPFRNTIDLIDLKGSVIKDVLEHSVSRLTPYQKDDLDGRFLQFSGLRVKYNLYKPVGQRVIGIKVICTNCTIPMYEDLVSEKIYTVILPNFIANGGDDYEVIVNNKYNHVAKGDLDSDVFNKHLIQFSPLIQGLDGRIEFVEEYSECSINGGNNIFNIFNYSVFICLIILINTIL